jgi:lipoate-protein ligase A
MKSGKLNPAENMAIDEAIFQGVIEGISDPTIRFYDWEPSTVSCGYNQEIKKEVDFSAIKRFNFGFVRRPTGGRLVLHDNEVTYSVIAPISNRLSGNVTQSYLEISRALIRGFLILGVKVDFEKGNLSSSNQRQDSNPCFTSTSRFEILYNNKKIVGSAQIRKKDALLQHGSILLNYNQSKIAYILPSMNVAERDRLARYLSMKSISINEILESYITFEKAVESFEQGFKKSWDNDEFYTSNELNLQERKKTKFLLNSKYLSDDWNKRK